MRKELPCSHTGYEIIRAKPTLYGNVKKVICGNCGIVKRIELPEALLKKGGKSRKSWS